MGSVAIAAALVAAPGVPARLRPDLASSSHVLSVRDVAKVQPASSNGDVTVEVGPATGTLKGTLRFSSTVAGAVFHFTFTLQTGAGTISGSGRGTLTFGRRPYASFQGSGSVDRGSGAYLHAAGTGRFYGAENRITHSGTVQVQASVHY